MRSVRGRKLGVLVQTEKTGCLGPEKGNRVLGSDRGDRVFCYRLKKPRVFWSRERKPGVRLREETCVLLQTEKTGCLGPEKGKLVLGSDRGGFNTDRKQGGRVHREEIGCLDPEEKSRHQAKSIVSALPGEQMCTLLVCFCFPRGECFRCSNESCGKWRAT